MPCLSRWRRAATLTLALVSTAPICSAAGTGTTWSSVPLPIARLAFAELLGLDANTPRTILLAQAIRRLHDADVRGGDLRARVVATLRSARPAPSTETVPLPLTPQTWCRAILIRCDPAAPIGSLLTDPRAGFMYLGLSAVDESTRLALQQDLPLLTWIARNRAGTFAAFGVSVHVADGQVATPGGAEARRVWERLVGAPASDPPAFVRALLTSDGGRLAYFYSTVAQLDPPHQRFALGAPNAANAAAGAAETAKAFAAIDPGWEIESHPYVRAAVDGATVLLRVGVTGDGRIQGVRSQRFWARALAADAGATIEAREAAALLAGDDLSPAWLIERIAGEERRTRGARLQMVLFGQRALPPLTPGSVTDALAVIRSVERTPALMFTLERMGIQDLPLMARLVRRATVLSAIVDGDARTDGLNQWQGAIALIERMVVVGTFEPSQARELLDRLDTSCTSAENRVTDGVARWLEQSLTPALTATRATHHSLVETGDSIDGMLIAALAGVSPASTIVQWEGASYMVDLARAERDRLVAIRAGQTDGGVDVPLQMFALARALTAGASQASRDDLRRRAALLSARLQDPDAWRTSKRLPLTTWSARLQRMLQPKTTLSAHDEQRDATALRAAAGPLLGEGLRALVYAVALGNPEGRVFLAGDVAMLHDFGVDRPGMPPGALSAWAPAVEDVAAGRSWRVRGSLLALDVALGHLTLRHMLGEMPAHEALLGTSQRRALVATMALTRGLDLTDRDRDALVAAIEQGRARVRVAAARPETRASLCRDAGLCGWRSELTAWALDHEPAALFATVSRAELVWLGWSASAPPPAPWGSARTAIDGALRLQFPDPAPIDLTLGRPTLGHVFTGFADLKLRLAELLATLHIPAPLLPSVLQAALQDFIDEVQPAYPDDWLALVAKADAMGRIRVEDYVASLAVPGGPLVPAPTSQGDPR
jgi:hypothetical protein